MDEREGPLHGSVANALLRRLDPEDYACLRPHLTRVPLALGAQIATAREPIAALCFPEAGVIGLLDALASGRRLAVGLVGREGLVGWPVALGIDRWPYDAVVRGEDASAIMVDADRLVAAMDRRPGIRTLLLRYVGSFVAQLSQTIASNLIHSVEARAARWILLYHDRLRGDDVLITHEEFGLMLGVRRSSITDALHLLEGQGAIRGQRGRIVVRDRARLEALVVDTYGRAEREHERLIERG